MRKYNLTGQTFGRLKVIELSDRKDTYAGRLWKCECSCGNITYVSANRLVRDNTRSCGCMAEERRRAKREMTVAEPKTDCIMYRSEARPYCSGLTELLCVTRGKCNFYKSGGDKHEDKT